MRKATGARPGVSPWANAAGRSTPFGIVGERSGSEPVSWRGLCAIPSIPTRRYGSSYVASLGRTPWYLLTAEPISTDEDAWRVVFTYMRSLQIELTWRFNKSELAGHSSTAVASTGARETLGLGDVGLCLSLALVGATV